MRVGIIGGTGKMGGFFRGVFERAGHEVMVTGRTTKLHNQDLVEKSDVIVVSVPIHTTVPLIRDIAPYLKKDQLICDLTSLKEGPVNAMLTSAAEVIGFHPMFGPGVTSLKGQTILACPSRVRPASFQRLASIFRDQGARVVVTTPEEHDRLMAIVQALVHYSTLCMAETMRLMGTDIMKALECTSPIYRIEMGLIGRLLNQDPDLYGDMLTMNPHVPPVIHAFGEATTHLRSIIEQGDMQQFREMFSDNATTFESYQNSAVKETDDLIEFLVNR